MKKLLLMALAMTCLWTTTHAQVGINTTTPAPGTILDIHADNKGILIPRVDIDNPSTGTQIDGGTTNGLLVYNTNTSTGEGFYYWYNTQWIPMGSEFSWRLTGNSGVDPATNFLGTVTNHPLVFRTNNVERMRILDNGQVIINSAIPNYTEDRFTVIGNIYDYAINGYTSNSTAVYGENSAGTGNGLYGNSTNIGVRGIGAHGGYYEAVVNNGYGLLAQNITSTSGSPDRRVGIQGVGQNLPPLLLNNMPSGAVFRGTNTGASSFASNTNGNGIRAIGNGLTVSWSLTTGSGVAATGASTGVYGIANNTVGDRSGGYFEANINLGEIYAYVGAFDGTTNYKIIGNGTVSTIVKDTNDNLVTMFAPEAPEVLFQDYGIGQLINGSATIKLDPILTKNILVNEKHPLKVFIQLEGDCNGVYVTNKSDKGFEVVELQGGTSNVSFSWNIVATRANEFVDGVLVSKYDVRFPDAPGPLETNLGTANEVKDNTLQNIVTEEINNKGNTLQAE